MATNFAADVTTTNIATRHDRLSFEHRFFLTVAVLFPVITVIGFAPSYYFKTVFNGPPLPGLLVHLHGLVQSVWIVLFAVQVYLISSKRIRLHMTLGIFGSVLAAAIVVIGVMTGYAAMARGGAFPGYSATEFFVVPVGSMINFAILFFAAIYYRKDPAAHKRLMLLTVVNFLGPSIGRLPLPFIPELGAWWFYGVPYLIAAILLAADTYRTGKLNRAFAAGVILLILTGPIELALARTAAWTQLATWMVS